MKIMQVTLSIDVKDPIQVEALKNLMDALAGENTTVKVVKEEEQEKPAPVKKRTARRAAPAPEPEPEEEEQEEQEEEIDLATHDDIFGGEEEQEEQEEEIDLATLRELTADKAKKYRAEIKEKLSELGASNVSSIKEKDFRKYYDYLQSLK